MNPKTTLLLFFLALLLGGGIWLLERRVPTTRARTEADAQALAFDPRRLDHIEMRFAGGEAFVLHVSAGFWRLTEPFDDVADPDRVQRLITELAGMEMIERLRPEEFSKEAWAATGLEEPVVKLRLMAGAEKLLDVWLGKEGVLENTSYASLMGSSDNGSTSATRSPVRLRTNLHTLLKEPPAQWRDSKLLRLPAETVLRVRLDNGDGQIELSRETGGETAWSLVKPLQTRASQERVNDLLAVLLNLDILSSELATVATTPGTAPAGATSPPDQLSILVETAVSSHEITLAKPADETASETEGQVSHRRPHFKITSERLPLLWAGPNFLRDNRLARVEAENVEALGIRSAAFPEVELRQENQSWLLHRHGNWEPANGDRVARVFETLNQTTILEFTSDSSADLVPYGLDQPFMTLWWREQGQQAVRELHFGHNAEQTKFYVKDGAEPFIRRVSADVLPRLPADPLKWRGLGLLRFSQFDLRRVTLAIGTAPPAVLDYDPATAAWTGRVGDQDISAMIDRAKADTLAGALGRLNVNDWSTAIAEGLEALKNTTIRIQITLQESGNPQAKPRTHDLRFAPTQKGMDTALYYGRLDENPDVFFITRESLRGLLTPVFKDGAGRQ
jgi:hypothetical protein